MANFFKEMIYVVGQSNKVKNESTATEWAKEHNGYLLKMQLAGSGDMGWRKRDSKGRFIVGSKTRDPNTGLRAKIKNLFSKEKISDEEKTKIYGKSLDEEEGTSIKVNRDNGVMKDTVSMAGPMGMGGASDSGEYKIENNVERAIATVTKLVNPVINKDKNRYVMIYLKGHSRNAVTTSRLAMSVSNIYRNNKNVNILAEQFDPVPGPFHFGVDSECDYGKPGKIKNLSTVLIQSLKTEHSFFFSPQKVLGAQKIILLKCGHEVGLYASKKYVYEGKEFHGFSLNELKPGVYLQKEEVGLEDETPIELQKYDVSDKKQVDELLKKIGDAGGITQIRRTKSLKEEVLRKQKDSEAEREELSGQIVEQAKNKNEFNVEENNKSEQEDESNELYDNSDPRLVKYCTWLQVPFLENKKNIKMVSHVNIALKKLQNKIEKNQNSEMNFDNEKGALRDASNKCFSFYRFSINRRLKQKRDYCKFLKERIDEENNKKVRR